MKILKYIHPAANKYTAGKSYSLDDLKKELSLDMIKVMFEPLSFKWSDLEYKGSPTKKVKVDLDEQ